MGSAFPARSFVAFIVCIAPIAWSPDETGSPDDPDEIEAFIAHVARLVAIPQEGCYQGMSRVVTAAPSQDAAAEAVLHARRAMTACRGRTIDEEYIPAAARSVEACFPVSATDQICFSGSRWHVTSRERENGAEVAERHLMSDGHEVAYYSVVGGVRSRTRRYRQDSFENVAIFSLLQFGRIRHVALTLVAEFGRRGMGLEEGPEGVGFRIDTRPDAFWGLFDIVPPHGVIQVSSHADVRIVESGGATTLAVRWLDCFGFDILRTTATWIDGQVFPSTIVEERLLPGTRRSVRTTVNTYAQVSRDGDAAAPWIPVPGERVVDLRFLSDGTNYSIDADGSMPDDDALIAEAEARALLHETTYWSDPVALSQRTLLDPHPEDVGVVQHDILAQPASVDLGTVPIGSRHPIQLFLTNTGSQAVHLEQPTVQCGCLQTRLSRSFLEPGRSAMLSAVQEVQRAGRQLSTIEIPIAGAPEGVVVEVIYDGAAAPLLHPRAIPLGVVDSDAWPRTIELFFDDQGCLDDGQQPEFEFSGDFDGALEATALGPRTWRVAGEVAPIAGAPFGALEATISVRVAGDRPAPGNLTRLSATVRAPGEAPWPPCRLALRPGTDQELVFGAIRVDGVTLAADARRWLAPVLRHDDAGTTLVLQWAGGARPPPRIMPVDVDLRSDAGRIRVHVVLSPH